MQALKLTNSTNQPTQECCVRHDLLLGDSRTLPLLHHVPLPTTWRQENTGSMGVLKYLVGIQKLWSSINKRRHRPLLVRSTLTSLANRVVPRDPEALDLQDMLLFPVKQVSAGLATCREMTASSATEAKLLSLYRSVKEPLWLSMLFLTLAVRWICFLCAKTTLAPLSM